MDYKEMGRQYNSIRNSYDAGFNSPTQQNYQNLKNQVYNLKSEFTLPNSMYNSVNSMQNNFGQQLGGLENKLFDK